MNTRVLSSERGMRRTPSQQRSRVMVATILEAAARVLAYTGWTEFTTNQVANVAGVSIGSLYQYFPNKLALAEAIRQQHLEKILRVLATNQTGKIGHDSLTERVSELLDGILAAHRVNPVLHRVLLDEVPLSRRDGHPGFEQLYNAYYLAFTTEALGEASLRAPVVARVLASAIEGVVHQAARRGELESSSIRCELEWLVCAYLGQVRGTAPKKS